MRVELAGRTDDGLIEQLAAILLDAVAGGASIGFLDDLTAARARHWWQESLARPNAVTFAAHDGDEVVGVVQLLLATPDNQPHRADVVKLLVLRSARGRGVATALLAALEAEALRRDRWLLVLDTETGSPAESIYAGKGWLRVGTVADYAAVPDGRLISTTFMTKRLR